MGMYNDTDGDDESRASDADFDNDINIRPSGKLQKSKDSQLISGMNSHVQSIEDGPAVAQNYSIEQLL